MQQAVQRAADSRPLPVESVSNFRAAPVNLGVDWNSRGEEFRTSLRDFFTGPRPSRTRDSAAENSLKIELIEPRAPLRGFVASCLWHVATIWLMILPIWGFLPKSQPAVQAPQIELTWYTTPEDLRQILLPAAPRKPAPAAHRPKPSMGLKAAPSEPAFHPRQTILSVPVRITHPRQTLIEPKAPPIPPKLAPNLPNIVEWAASAPPKLQLQLSASTAAPRMERRDIRRLDAPEIANPEHGAPLNLLASDAAPARLAIPLGTSRSRAALRRNPGEETRAARAPEIGATPQDQASLRRLIALSTTPALPAPRVAVPKGNLAAPINLSPKGRTANSSHPAGGMSPGKSTMEADSGAQGSESLPAAISITGGDLRPKSATHASANFRRSLDLRPFSRADAASLRPSAPVQIDMKHLNPSLPPETILEGKRIYTMHVSMPNVTSASGSWILNFAQLDAGTDAARRPQGALSGPQPIFKVDPIYPPKLIREHVQGEVVLFAIIRKNGSVDSIRVMRSLDPQLDRDAAAALAQWRFRPATRAGAPVDVEAVVHIPFNYQAPEQ